MLQLDGGERRVSNNLVDLLLLLLLGAEGEEDLKKLIEGPL